jgi:hypothetical protein
VLLAIQAGPGSEMGWLRRWTRSCRPRRAGGGGGVVVAVPGARGPPCFLDGGEGGGVL